MAIKNLAVYSYQKYDNALAKSLDEHLDPSATNVKIFSVQLNAQTAALASGCEAVCIFVNDKADAETIKILASMGVKLLLLRSAGFNHVDLAAAEDHGIVTMRVPQYSPNAVAEMAVGLLLSLVRRIPKAYNRVREHNFNLSGLEGFTIAGKTIGVLGTGKIGQITAQILKGFGPAKLLGYDVYQSQAMKDLGMEYVSVDELIEQSDIISLHLPLLPSTYHCINREQIQKMKKGVVIINVSRGGLVDAQALEEGLKEGKIGGVGMDVYENEGSFFFNDCSDQILTDDVLSRLLTFHNVVITAHQAFLTKEALDQIANTTLTNLQAFNDGVDLQTHENIVHAPIRRSSSQAATKQLPSAPAAAPAPSNAA